MLFLRAKGGGDAPAHSFAPAADPGRCDRRALRPGRDMPVFNPKASDRRTARRRRATRRAGAARRSRRKSWASCPTPTSTKRSTADRPVRSADHRQIRSCRPVASTTSRKGEFGHVTRCNACFRDPRLCDLLRDLPLSDRVRRRLQLRQSHGRRRATGAGRRGGGNRRRADRSVRPPAQRHGAPGLQALVDQDRARRRPSAASMCSPQASR